MGVDPNDDDRRVPLLVFEACTYTIQSGGTYEFAFVLNSFCVRTELVLRSYRTRFAFLPNSFCVRTELVLRLH